MFGPKGQMKSIAFLTFFAAVLSVQATVQSHPLPEYPHICGDPIDNIYYCDFKDETEPVEINDIRDTKASLELYNAISIKIRGQICSDVRFSGIPVVLNGSTACPITLDFIETKIDKLPEGVQHILISNSEIEELVSHTLRTAEIIDAKIQLLDIRSGLLEVFKVSNTKINTLNEFHLPKGSNVTFSNSELVEEKTNPFSSNGGDLKNLKLHETTGFILAPKTQELIKSSDSDHSKHPDPGLEVAVGILSVAVIILGIMQLMNYLEKRKKSVTRAQNNEHDTSFSSTNQLVPLKTHYRDFNCSTKQTQINEHDMSFSSTYQLVSPTAHCKDCNCSTKQTRNSM